MSSNTPPMTPLDAAQAIIDARARATQGEWRYGPDLGRDCCECGETMYTDFAIVGAGHNGVPAVACIIEDANEVGNRDFIALSANHAAAVAQALIDAESKITAMRQAFAEWESVRTFRNDVNSHEWLTLVAAMEGDK